MEVQDEKKPPVGGLVVVDQWNAVMLSDGSVMLQRVNPAGRVIETWRNTTPARAAVDLVAIMQGCEPVRETLRPIEPIGPKGY